MNSQDRKIQILKIRINSLIDEHADVLVQAQEFHDKLQKAEEKIANLERELKQINVQKEEPIIINHSVDATNN